MNAIQTLFADATSSGASLAVVIGVALLVIGLVSGVIGGKMPYRLRPHFLSPNERSFYRALHHACGANYRIFAQVRLADIMESGLPVRWFHKIAAKSIDFIVVDAATLEYVAGIEVDDKTHEQRDRRIRDAFVDKVFETAGLPLYRFPAAGRYHADQIRQNLPFLLTSWSARSRQSPGR